MTSPRLAAAVTAAAAVLVLAGCSGGSNGEGVSQPTSTGPHSTAASPVPTATTGGPTPDTTQTSALLTALAAVDPALASDQTRAVSDAVTACGRLRQGDDPSQAIPAAFPELSLSASQVTAVADAIESSFCPTSG